MSSRHVIRLKLCCVTPRVPEQGAYGIDIWRPQAGSTGSGFSTVNTVILYEQLQWLISSFAFASDSRKHLPHTRLRELCGSKHVLYHMLLLCTWFWLEKKVQIRLMHATIKSINRWKKNSWTDGCVCTASLTAPSDSLHELHTFLLPFFFFFFFCALD